MKPKFSEKVVVALSPDQKAILEREAQARGFTNIGAFCRYLAKNFDAGSVFIIEYPTWKMLYEEVEGRLMRKLTKMMREELRLELISRGFISH